MESVGEFLRLEREAQGKSIEDVAKVTKMSPLTISALEDDRFSALPAPVYVKGHLRTYARFLGLKENEVIEKYLRFTQQQEHEELDEWDTVELELHEEKQRAGRRWIWIAASVAAAVTVIVVWTLASQRGGTPEAAVNQGAVGVPEQALEGATQDTLIEWNKLELTVKARERTWIQVTVDGATLPVADFHLGAGEERTYEANKYFQLQVGNGGALELYLNGEYLGTAGAGRGLVENLIVNVEGMSR
jgi:transcriptional regulator with XRE-family HTH domain